MEKRASRQRLAWLCGALLALTSAATGSGGEPSEVIARAVHRKSIVDRLSYPGQVGSSVNATFVADSDGMIRKIYAQLGKAVSTGQRILTLENTDRAYHFAPVIVRATVSGVINSFEVTEGSRVIKGQRLGSITDPSKILVKVEVSAGDIRKIGIGLVGQFRSQASKTPAPVRVLGLSPTVDPATGTATAELAIESGSASPGELGQVTFEVNPRESFLVPEEAIVYRRSQPFVRKVSESKAHWVAVELGPYRETRTDHSDLIEIASGVEDGDLVIESASGFISEGDQVSVKAAE